MLDMKEKNSAEEKSMVSVVIPNYNYGHFLPEAIESVISQTYKNWELIIVDDNSTDNSRKIAKKYIEEYPQYNIKLIHNETGPSGTPTPINIGINAMHGDYFAWLSSDDIFKPEKLKKQVEILDNNDSVDLVFTNYDELYNDGCVKRKFFPQYNQLPRKDSFLLLLEGNYINGNTVLIRKSVFEKVGLFIEKWEKFPEIWRVTEYLKWVEIALCSNIYQLNEDVHTTRMHDWNGIFYQTNLPVELSSLAFEWLFEEYSFERIAEYLGLDSDGQKISVYARICGVLSLYKKVYIINRILGSMNSQLSHNVLDDLKKIEEMRVVAQMANFICKRDCRYEDLLFYELHENVLDSLSSEELYHIASTLKKAGKYKDSKKIFNFVIKKQSPFTDFLHGALFHLGEIFYEEADVVQARECLRACIAIEPEHKAAKKLLQSLKINA